MNRHRFNVYAPVARVDRAGHVLYGVSAMQAVEALGHRLMIDATSLAQFVALGNAATNGLKSRFTHPGLSADGLGKHLGRMRNFRVEGDKAIGDLYLSESAARSPHGDLRAYVESLAAEDPAAFGMSVVVDGYGAWQLADGSEVEDDKSGKPAGTQGQYPALRVTAAYAVDAVDEPAANRDGLFSAFRGTTSELAASVYAVLDRTPDAPALAARFVETGDLPAPFREMADEYDIDEAKARVFAAQYLEHRARHTAPARINLAANAAPMESVPMNEEKQTGAAPAQPAAPAPTGNEWLDALRQSTADAMIQASGLPPAIQQRLSRGQYGNPAAVGVAIEEARAELAALQEAQVVQMGNRPPRGGYQVNAPMDDARGLVEYFFGVSGAPLPPPNMRRFSDLYVALTGDVEFRGVFDPTRLMFASATTGTLANLAADAMNKVIVEKLGNMAAWRWYEQLVEVVPNNGTLLDINLITFGGVGNLPKVAEGASYPELPVDDAKEIAEFQKRGGYVGITREAIKNSDIMQLQAIPRALAAAAVRTRSAAVAALFTANAGVGPTLSDGKALFHADHGNVATTALGTDATAWRAARAAAYVQTELNSGAALGIFPQYLLVPVALYDVALTILGYGVGTPTSFVPEAVDRGIYDPRPIPVVVPEWTDPTDWAYLVDPDIYPVIQMSYSQAPGGGRHPAPELFSVTSETSGLMFTNDILPIKVRDEFALGVNGYQGIGKRNVAG